MKREAISTIKTLAVFAVGCLAGFLCVSSKTALPPSADFDFSTIGTPVTTNVNFSDLDSLAARIQADAVADWQSRQVVRQTQISLSNAWAAGQAAYDEAARMGREAEAHRQAQQAHWDHWWQQRTLDDIHADIDTLLIRTDPLLRPIP